MGRLIAPLIIMPTSRYETIPFVLDLVVKYQPKSILDIGCGTGKFGMLFREYLDIWKIDKEYNKRIVNITGIEVFEEYDNPIWQVYDKVITKNVFDILPKLSKTKFDLVFMGDVIEHFTKENGFKLLCELFYKHIIIVTPLNVLKQKAVYNNEFEEHRSEWKHQDFPKLEYKLINNSQIIYG